jgi:hypothetical protein
MLEAVLVHRYSRIKSFRPAVLVLAAVVLAGAGANAAPIFQIDFASSPTTSTENTGSAFSIGFGFFSGSSGEQVELTLANATPPAIGSSLTAVGLEWPDGIGAKPVFATGGKSSYFDVLSYDASVSPGWLKAPGGYDVMITSDGSFEGGSPQGAPEAGQSQVVRLDIGHTGLTTVQLGQAFHSFYSHAAAPFAIARFQSVGRCGDMSDKVATPEPATLAMLSCGALWLLRRRHAAA